MNRRAVIGLFIAIPLASEPLFAKAAESWVLLGKRLVGSNTRSVSFAIGNETKDVRKLGIELRGNSVWLYDLELISAGGNSVVEPVNINLPPSSAGCKPRSRIWQTGEQPKNVRLSLNCCLLYTSPSPRD